MRFLGYCPGDSFAAQEVHEPVQLVQTVGLSQMSAAINFSINREVSF